MAQPQIVRIGLRRSFSRFAKIGLQREEIHVLQHRYVPVLHHVIQKATFSSNLTKRFYDSLKKDVEEVTRASKLLPKHTLKGTTFAPFEIFESNPERYYFVKLYKELNGVLSKNVYEEKDDHNWKCLSFIDKSISRVFQADEVESIRSTKEFDAKLDVLFNGLQNMLMLTEFNDMKTRNYLNKVVKVQVDLSCFIFDQLCDQQSLEKNLMTSYSKKLLFNLGYLWLRVESHIKKISPGGYYYWQWNERSSFFLKLISYYLLQKKDNIIKSLEPQEFLFCLYLIGLHRRLPGMFDHTSHFNIEKTNFPIPIEIEEMILSCFAHYGLQEVGMLSHSIYYAHLLPNKKLQTEILVYLHTIPDTAIISENILSITSILKLATKFDKNDDLCEKIIARYVPYLNQFDIHGKIQFGKFTRQQSSTYGPTFVKPFVESLKYDIGHCQMKDLFYIAKTIAEMKHTETLDEHFCEELMQSAVKCARDSGHINDARYFIKFTFQMSCLSYYSERVINELIKITNDSEKLKMAQNAPEVTASAVSDIFSRVSGTQGLHRITKEQGYNKHLVKQHAVALKYIALLDSQLDTQFQNYRGERLNPEIKKKLEALDTI